MPVSVKSKQTAETGLRVPQARVLRVLIPLHSGDPPSEWPIVTRATMRVACKLSPTNSMNRLLHGIKEGKGKHLGLIELGLIEEIPLDIDGVTEYNYRITRKGVECLSRTENLVESK